MSIDIEINIYVILKIFFSNLREKEKSFGLDTTINPSLLS